MAEFCNRHAWPKSEEHLDTFGGGIRRPMGVFGGHTRGYAPTADDIPHSSYIQSIRFPTNWIFTYILLDKLQFSFIVYNMIIIAGLP